MDCYRIVLFYGVIFILLSSFLNKIFKLLYLTKANCRLPIKLAFLQMEDRLALRIPYFTVSKLQLIK